MERQSSGTRGIAQNRAAEATAGFIVRSVTSRDGDTRRARR